MIAQTDNNLPKSEAMDVQRDSTTVKKTCDITFGSGDAQAYSTARANLKRGIKRAKFDCKMRIEEHFANTSDSRHMWQGIQAITNYK